MNSKLEMYYEYLIEENKKYNLTSITDKESVYIKHFMDSLSLKDIIDLNKNLSICDVGSGAGFPGLVLALYYPNLSITIIEPTLKRVNFMKKVCSLLNLCNVVIYCGRAEDLARIYEEKFDIVTARAVAQLPILIELLVRFCKIKGYVICYKGDKGHEEIINSKKALDILDCTISNIYNYELDKNYGKRTLIKIIKEKKTNTIYPRKYSEIKRKPL